jgi:transcriptional regulator with XRE-family HTH domain
MERLKDWLEKSHTSQRAFAAEMKVTQAVVSLWVQGKGVPRLENLKKISERTGLSFDELLGEQPKRRRLSN